MTTVRRLAVFLTISIAGVAGILVEEGRKNKAYLDPVGIPTICVGHTEGVKLGDIASDEVCAELLRKDSGIAQDAVRRSIQVPITQGQFDALTSLTFNIGGAALHTSTLARKLNAGDCLGAAAEFDRWVFAKGKKLPGLVKRRANERKIFEAGCR